MKDQQPSTGTREVQQLPARERTRWFRFSVGSLILLTAVIALAISHALTSLRLWHEKEEVGRAYAAAGMFDAPDPDRLYVLPIRQPLLLVWQWRIYVPPGNPYRTDLSEFVPRSGYPHKVWPVELTPGENLLTIQLIKKENGMWRVIRSVKWRKNDQQAKYFQHFSTRELQVVDGQWLEEGGKEFPPASTGRAPWIGNRDGKVFTYPHSEWSAGKVTPFPSDKQKMLLFRLIDPHVPSPDNDGNEGLLIWLEEVNVNSTHGNQPTQR